MKREINLSDQKVSYTLRQSRQARHLRLTVYCDGDLVVTAPRYLDIQKIEEFILKKAGWIIKKIGFMKRHGGNKTLARHSRREYLKLKKQALEFAKSRVEKFNGIYGCQYNKISIRNQKTRWGSCSRKGNLNFNYKILLLPEKCADYIIVHELCHLKEFNHSQKFWKIVAAAVPDYKAIIKQIRKL